VPFVVGLFCRRRDGRLRARIKAHNDASRRVAARAGMRLINRREDIDLLERPAR